MSLSGYLAAGGLALSIAAGLGGYFHGLDTGRSRERQAQQKAVDAANATRDRLRGQIEQAALAHLQADQERGSVQREIVRENTQIVERPVYRTQCIDDDGVRQLDRAADNANAGGAGASAGDAGAAPEG